MNEPKELVRTAIYVGDNSTPSPLNPDSGKKRRYILDIDLDEADYETVEIQLGSVARAMLKREKSVSFYLLRRTPHPVPEIEETYGKMHKFFSEYEVIEIEDKLDRLREKQERIEEERKALGLDEWLLT